MKLIHNFTLLAALTFATFSCKAMESNEQVSSLNDDSTTKPLTSMELAKQYGYIGCLIKQIGTSNNAQLPELVTDLIIKFVKDDLIKSIPQEKMGKLIFEQTFTIPIHDWIHSLDHHPMKSEVALGTKNRVVLWDIEKARSDELTINASSQSPAYMMHLKYSPHGKLLAGATKTDLSIWDLTTRTVTHSMPGIVNDMLFTPDETQLVIGTDQRIIIWNLLFNTFKETSFEIKLGDSQKLHITCSSDGTTFAHNNAHGIIVWDFHHASIIKQIDYDKPQGSIAFGHDKTQRAYALRNKILMDTDEVQNNASAPNRKIGMLIYCSLINKYFLINQNFLTVKITSLYYGPPIEEFDLQTFDPHDNSFNLLKKFYNLNQYTFNNNGTKLAILYQPVKEKIITTQITHVDLFPDFTIEQLRAMVNGKI
jgi:WD40 repeat protein